MKRLLAFLILLGLPALGQAQTTFPQNLAATIDVPFTLTATVEATTSGTVTSFTFYLTKYSATSSTTATTIVPTASGGSNDLVYRGILGNFELTAANLDTPGNTSLCWSYVNTTIADDCKWFTVVNANAYDVNVASGPASVTQILTDLNTIEAAAVDLQGRVPAALTGAGNIKADALAWNGITTVALPATPGSITAALDTFPRAVAYPNFVVTFFNTNGTRKTDLTSAAISCNVFLDGGAANPVDDTTETELSDADAPGVWLVDLTAAETTGDSGVVVCKTTGGLYAQSNFQTQH